MARSEARIFVDIWNDEDFTALNPHEQRLYFFLVSQRDLEHTGVLPLRVPRWVRKARGLTAEQITEALDGLQRSRHVVVDEDTGELLIRSLIRRDKVYRQPNVMRAAVDHVPQVESKQILTVLLAEVQRIAESEQMSDNAALVVKEMIAALEEAGASPPDNPSGNPSPNPSPNPSDMPTAEPRAEPSDIPTRAIPGERGVVTAVSTDSPLPIPLAPSPGKATPSPSNRASRAKQRTEGQTDTAADLTAASVVAAYIDGARESRRTVTGQIRKQVGATAKRLIAEGTVPTDELIKAAQEMGRRGWKDLDMQLLRGGDPATNGYQAPKVNHDDPKHRTNAWERRRREQRQ